MRKHYFSVFYIIAFIVLLTWSGCRKNDSGSDNISPAPPDLSTKINSSVSGFVTDENNAAIWGASVSVGGVTQLTDKYGYFEVNNVPVVKDAATVTISRTGYFKAIKTYIAKEGKKAFFRIKLIPKKVEGSFGSGTGGTVTLPNGLGIQLPANAVVNAATNAAYSGTVNVAAYWIDPTSSELSRIMPGDLRGINTDGNAQLLTTYGMAAVELTGSGGETLQVAPGKKATLHFPIPSGISANAPATIPLWYFDEGKGLWKQEGSAAKTGSSYTGEVSHFSFWNCDVPADFVQFDCTVVTANGQPVPNAYVRIQVQNNPYSSGYGYTNTSGYVNGAVPNNSQLVLAIYSNTSCTTPSYTQNFSTGNTNISLGNIVIPTATTLATVSGRVVNCSNNPVSDGYIMLWKDNSFTRTALSSTGTYSLNILLCGSNSITLTGEDAAASQQSTAANYTITPGSNSIPDIQACGTSTSEFLDYTLNGTLNHHALPTDSIFMIPMVSGASVNIGGKRPISNIVNADFNMDLAGIALGSMQTINRLYFEPLMGSSLPAIPTSAAITEYGSIGQFISGNFTSVVIFDPPGPPPPVTYNVICYFRVRRSI